jgi:hypothetical protein
MLGIEFELVVEADGIMLVGLEVALCKPSDEFLATDSKRRFLSGCLFSDPVDEVDGDPAVPLIGGDA